MARLKKRGRRPTADGAARAIARVLEREAGYRVTALGERMSACRLEDGRYAVVVEDADGREVEERLFMSAEEAAAFFETHRKRLKMGFEFEKG